MFIFQTCGNMQIKSIIKSTSNLLTRDVFVFLINIIIFLKSSYRDFLLSNEQ